MRENDIAAVSLGLDIWRLRFVAFLFSAAYAGVAGALYVHTIRVISPEVLEFHIMVACLTMAVVGGRTAIAGAILGAFLLVHLPEWFRGLQQVLPDRVRRGTARDDRPRTRRVDRVDRDACGHACFPKRRDGAGRAAALPPRRAPCPRPGRCSRCRDVAIAFGGVRALDGVSLEVKRGEIFGLIGPNGSGKTTLVNCITGIYSPSGGPIVLAGAEITGRAALRNRARRASRAPFRT